MLDDFTFSHFTIFADVSLIKPKDSFNPLFRAILYTSMSWVLKLVNMGERREKDRDGMVSDYAISS